MCTVHAFAFNFLFSNFYRKIRDVYEKRNGKVKADDINDATVLLFVACCMYFILKIKFQTNVTGT